MVAHLIAALFLTVHPPKYQIVLYDKNDEIRLVQPVRKVRPTVEKIFHVLHEKKLKGIISKVRLLDMKGKFVIDFDNSPFKLERELRNFLEFHFEE